MASVGDSCSNIEEGARSPVLGIRDCDRCDRALALALVLNFWIFSASSCTFGFLRLKGLREMDRYWIDG